MRLLLVFVLITLLVNDSNAQKRDTVIIQYDSTFTSLFARRLYDKRTPVKYTMQEFGNIRGISVFLSKLEELETGQVRYGVRIDARLNRNLFTDAPATKAEYIDEDELDYFIDKLNFIHEITQTDVSGARYTEYRFYTRSGIALECYTGVNRWRALLLYEINKVEVSTYLNNENRLTELIDVLNQIKAQIRNERK